MIKRYRRTSSLVQAIQFTGSNQAKIIEFINMPSINTLEKYAFYEFIDGQHFIIIPTEDNLLKVKVNDWVVKQPKNKIEVYTADKFKENYVLYYE